MLALESPVFNKPSQQYHDQTDSKNEVGTARVQNEQYMLSPYDSSPKQNGWFFSLLSLNNVRNGQIT